MTLLKLLEITKKCAGCALVGACICGAVAFGSHINKAGEAVEAVSNRDEKGSDIVINVMDSILKSIEKSFENTEIKITGADNNQIKIEAKIIADNYRGVSIDEIKAMFRGFGLKVID